MEGKKQWCAVALFILSDKPDEIRSDLNEILGQMRMPLSVVMERETIYRILEDDRNKVYEQSIRDSLTGLYRRVYMHESVQRLLDTHNRNITAGVAVVMVDVDHFKAINDTYGHTVGDMVLKKIGDIILEYFRSIDIPVRYGGEEFAIFIQTQKLESVMILSERLRTKVKEQLFTAEKTSFSVTVSAGVALHREKEELVEFINRADKALYTAKESGRDMTCKAE